MKNFSKFHETQFGVMILGDGCDTLASFGDASVDLVITSPPFPLLRPKEYGNVSADVWMDWFRPFAAQIFRVLKDSGSFVVDVGGVWMPGTPTRSLYQFKLLIMLCEEYGFHLAQDFFWWNPSKLPTPAEWVTVRRVRVKDAVNTVWWLSKSEWPKASNRRVLVQYSASQQKLLSNGYASTKRRPSGHQISSNFSSDNGAAIPPNLIAVPNTESNSAYLRYCKQEGLSPHPARFPVELPEFFVRLTTDKADLVVDPFAGSCTVGEACERLERNWVCVDTHLDYLHGAKGRFVSTGNQRHRPTKQAGYVILRPDGLYHDLPENLLPEDGGLTRRMT